MKWPFNKTRHLALAGGTNSSMLAELFETSGDTPPGMRVLATTRDLPVNNEINLNRLLSSIPAIPNGRISIALPLNFFETVALNLPMMPREAIGQALPYHLAKAASQPLNKLLYDWQIIGQQQEQLRIMAYLFPVDTFNLFQRELAHKELEIAALEVDVFAAFNYLIQHHRLPAADATICLLAWRKSISIAIYEQRRLTLVREVHLEKPGMAPEPIPETAAAADQQEEGYWPAETPESEEETEAFTDEAGEILSSDIREHILDSFKILKQEDLAPSSQEHNSVTPDEPEAIPALQQKNQPAVTQEDYMERIALEIMRTRDYYLSVIKGASVRKVFVAGMEDFMDALQDITEKSSGISIAPLITRAETQEDSQPILQAISIGTGTRW